MYVPCMFILLASLFRKRFNIVQLVSSYTSYRFIALWFYKLDTIYIFQEVYYLISGYFVSHIFQMLWILRQCYFHIEEIHYCERNHICSFTQCNVISRISEVGWRIMVMGAGCTQNNKYNPFVPKEYLIYWLT